MFAWATASGAAGAPARSYVENGAVNDSSIRTANQIAKNLFMVE